MTIKPLQYDKYGLPTKARVYYASGSTKEISQGEWYLQQSSGLLPAVKSDIYDFRAVCMRRQNIRRESDAAQRLGYDKNAWLKYCRESNVRGV